MDIDELRMFSEVCVSNLPLGSVYALLALSFVLVFKATQILNLCQGEVMMLGVYVTYSAVQSRLPFGVAVIVSLAVTATVAVLLERYVVRRFMGKPIFLSIMVTFGLAILLRGVIGILWGVDEKVLDVPYFEKMANVPLLHMNYGKLSAIFLAILFVLALDLFFRFSKIGLAMRATASNLSASMIMGVRVGGIFSLSWILAAIVSVLTGICLARMTILEPGISQYAFVALSALVLGGVDSIAGAIVGGYAVGIAEGLAVFYVGGQSKSLAGFIIMFLILMIKPYGLFGVKRVERV